MKVLNQWVHQYSFEYSVFLSDFVSDIIKNYKLRLSQNNGFDMVYDNPQVNEFILPRLHNLIYENYHVGENYHDYGLRVYIQQPNANKEDHSFYHNHAHVPGSLCAVFYLNIPLEGGGIAFQNLPYLKEDIIIPQLDTIYLFPTWLQHKALPHNGDNYRICFNWVYGGIIKPIHKFLGTPW